jgi:hypothetical protein
MLRNNPHLRTEKALCIIVIAVLMCFAPLNAENHSKSESLDSDQKTVFTLITTQTLTPLEKPSLESSVVYDFSTSSPSHNFSLDPAVPEAEFTNYPETYKYIQNYKKTKKFGKSLFQVSLAANLALNAADYFTTREALKFDGLEEGNPLMKPFTNNDLTFAAVKIGLSVSNYFIMKKLYKRNKALAWVVSIASNLALSYVVSSNMAHIHEARNW